MPKFFVQEANSTHPHRRLIAEKGDDDYDKHAEVIDKGLADGKVDDKVTKKKKKSKNSKSKSKNKSEEVESQVKGLVTTVIGKAISTTNRTDKIGGSAKFLVAVGKVLSPSINVWVWSMVDEDEDKSWLSQRAEAQLYISLRAIFLLGLMEVMARTSNEDGCDVGAAEDNMYSVS
ncbi:hypothetical protein BY996DRAFT_6519253 [Phakopsora pachyrhizi]|nr:hypothetical protein BY996DRAFT_6519253 [Phakopsora pachyrhizi]